MVPVCYGGEWGPDLETIGRAHGLSADEVVSVHSGAEYLVSAVGFTPGFPYLSGLPERLHTPRRETPRTRVPAGSVAIGGAQTGIYPFETPGGWNLIGRTPWRLFNPHARPPTLLQVGDRVRFRPITSGEYAAARTS
jgi:inhibitor of KinA